MKREALGAYCGRVPRLTGELDVDDRDSGGPCPVLQVRDCRQQVLRVVQGRGTADEPHLQVDGQKNGVRHSGSPLLS
jgi:hypothetical protein